MKGGPVVMFLRTLLIFSKPGVKFVLLPTPDLSCMHLIIEKLPMQVLISWWSSKSFARYVAL
jgi:hypothetical protein